MNLIVLLLLYAVITRQSESRHRQMPNRQLDEVRSYQDVAASIRKLVLNGTLKSNAYDRLAYFLDKFGPRPSGSVELERSLNFLEATMNKDLFENVHKEDAMIPHWERGAESAILISPRFKDVDVSTIGGSIGTTPKGITGHALVVKSFDELKNRSDEAAGKIVVFNQNFTRYADSVVYRLDGPRIAAKYDALAVLVRSPTPYSLYTVHTGMEATSSSGSRSIPAACITVEDAEMLQRMQKRGDDLLIKLVLGAKSLPPAKSKNVIGEIKGHKYPEEIVLIAAHVDSWDLSEGAMDDGAGIYVNLEAMLSLISLNLRPKRTIRLVLFTGEETGMRGARRYFKEHKDEVDLISIVMELDEGIYLPKGIKFQGTSAASAIMHEIMKLLQPINCTTVMEQGVEYGDVKYFIQEGVPGAVLLTKDDEYFYIHHTKADTMSIINSEFLDLATVAWATITYVLADLEDMLPR